MRAAIARWWRTLTNATPGSAPNGEARATAVAKWPKNLPYMIITVGPWKEHLRFCTRNGLTPTDRTAVRNINMANRHDLVGLTGPIAVYWLPEYDLMPVYVLNEIRAHIRAVEATTRGVNRKHVYVSQ